MLAHITTIHIRGTMVIAVLAAVVVTWLGPFLVGLLVGLPLVVVVGLAGFLIERHNRNRLLYLRKKYKNERLVQRLFKGEFWLNQTEDQLRDALGEPPGIEQKILKTKKKEIWKYRHEGHNRFGLRITLDNDIVTGWNKRD